jgi:hypothetical protein
VCSSKTGLQVTEPVSYLLPRPGRESAESSERAPEIRGRSRRLPASAASASCPARRSRTAGARNRSCCRRRGGAYSLEIKRIAYLRSVCTKHEFCVVRQNIMFFLLCRNMQKIIFIYKQTFKLFKRKMIFRVAYLRVEDGVNVTSSSPAVRYFFLFINDHATVWQDSISRLSSNLLGGRRRRYHLTTPPERGRGYCITFLNHAIVNAYSFRLRRIYSINISSQLVTWFSMLRGRGRAPVTRTRRSWRSMRVVDIVGGVRIVVLKRRVLKKIMI